MPFSNSSSDLSKKGVYSSPLSECYESSVASSSFERERSGDERGRGDMSDTVIFLVFMVNSGSGWARSQAEDLRVGLSLGAGRERKLWIISNGPQG
jgi:hypothetical protein